MIALLLLLSALLIAGFGVIRSRGTNDQAWGLLALALYLLWPRL
jgi:hypothetical protein